MSPKRFRGRARCRSVVRDLFTPRDMAPTVREAPAAGPPPVWLTYRCAKCGERLYSGFTTSALERKLREPGPRPDFFHADCGVETDLADADLHTQDGQPWKPSI